ncbi:MAG TPA: D-alanine--D-alanine ligase [Candidatus Fimimorpha excrementavium]|nr:D-alanine--D-alanine ligase [Candidatus Fimimorpha excrementavium]
MEKKTMAVLFGGQSSEHEISCMSVVNIVKCINQERYHLVLIGITKEGHWVKAESLEQIQDGSWRESKVQAWISPDATKKVICLLDENGYSEMPVDVVFPVLHGLYGEDGTIQGLLELAQIPYVGCGVLASAVSMDKLYTKIIVDTLGIRQAKYVGIHRKELGQMEEVLNRVENALPYPVFVKPSCAGSSKGVNKASNRAELENALKEAACHDSKILVEETIVGREIECAVLGNDDAAASGVGEILSAAEFYDFDAKYVNSESRTDVHPDLGDGVEEQVREDAVRIFHAVGGSGLARVDFFLDKDGVVFNEINTLPGFTAISMYPMLWEARGMEKNALIQRLIDLAGTKTR